MDKGKKRERNLNFTREETEKLLCLIETKKFIIENKKSDAVTWEEKKRAWKAIEDKFNSSGGGAFRDAKHLKQKYEALKKDTRKKTSLNQAEHSTDGGTSEASPLTPIEQKVKEIMFLSVEEVESHDNSDDQISEPEDQKPFDNLEEVDIAAMKKQLIEEELEEIVLKKQILIQELEHKKEMYHLEKQGICLKIDILTMELEHKKNKL